MNGILEIKFKDNYELVHKLQTLEPNEHHKSLSITCTTPNFNVTPTSFWTIFNFCYEYKIKSLSLGLINFVKDEYPALPWKGKVYLNFLLIERSSTGYIFEYILENSNNLFIKEILVADGSYLSYHHRSFFRNYNYLRKFTSMSDEKIRFVFPLDGTLLPMRSKNKNRVRNLEIEISHALTGNKIYNRKLLSHLKIHGEFDCKDDVLLDQTDKIINLYLARNNLIHNNCQKLILSVLALRKFRNTDLMRLHKNILLVILKELWDERFHLSYWNTSLVI